MTNGKLEMTVMLTWLPSVNMLDKNKIGPNTYPRGSQPLEVTEAAHSAQISYSILLPPLPHPEHTVLNDEKFPWKNFVYDHFFVYFPSP